ncbi:MAG TPA: tetratricopeptide repeat protein, partial [bacterium]|nr:tetratricopeptide repeat protein [bacterium]
MIRFCLITILALLSLTSFAWSQQAPTAQDYMQAAQDALQENDTTTAIQDYLLAIRIDPKNWQAYQNLGGCYIQIRKMGDAKAAYDMSLTINPNNPELRKFVAQVFGGPTATPTFELMAIPTATSTPMIYNPAFATPTSTPG